MVYTQDNQYYAIEKDTLEAIADSIRSKTGKTDKINVEDFRDEILGIKNRLPTPTITSIDGHLLTIDVSSKELSQINVTLDKVTGILYFNNIDSGYTEHILSMPMTSQPHDRYDLSKLNVPSGTYNVKVKLYDGLLTDSEISNAMAYTRE